MSIKTYDLPDWVGALSACAYVCAARRLALARFALAALRTASALLPVEEDVPPAEEIIIIRIIISYETSKLETRTYKL